MRSPYLQGRTVLGSSAVRSGDRAPESNWERVCGVVRMARDPERRKRAPSGMEPDLSGKALYEPAIYTDEDMTMSEATGPCTLVSRRFAVPVLLHGLCLRL